MKTLFTSIFCILLLTSTYAQLDYPCSYESVFARHFGVNPDAKQELEQNEKAIKAFLDQSKEDREQNSVSSIVIPVVMHVFHFGDIGKMDMEQALSGLDILNQDFNGLNDGWNTIDSEFDTIKGTLDITFCLASIDPDGNPTTGIIYHEDEDAVYNQGDLFQHAWDNYKYLNIYFPKYTQGAPSDFTAYAYYPSTFNTNANIDGIFYSSIRWGYGNHSELEEGQDWASVCSHEVGHWLNLRHTFNGGCTGDGDLVDDTPPTLTSGIELEGCNNNDFSCGVHTNGENFMDYNHDCKKMFTQGQIDRMTAALYLPSRINLWTEGNLVETGCLDKFTAIENISKHTQIIVYPNPAQDCINFRYGDFISRISIFNVQGELIDMRTMERLDYQLDLSNYTSGLYFYSILTDREMRHGQFVVR